MIVNDNYDDNGIARKINKLPDSAKKKLLQIYSQIDFKAFLDDPTSFSSPSSSTAITTLSSSTVRITANVNGKRTHIFNTSTTIEEILSVFLSYRLGHTPDMNELAIYCLVHQKQVNTLLPNNMTLEECGIVSDAGVESMWLIDWLID